MQHDDNATQKPWDLIIIGAGIYGIQVARTYLEFYPTKDVVVFDAANSIGGVWSRERVYTDFWTQTPLGILEFSDRPIHEIPRADQYFGFFKAIHVTQYLERYCSDHAYNGRTLSSRIHLDTSVTKVHKLDGRWLVDVTDGQRLSNRYCALQVVDASGLTSQPSWPDLPRRELFEGEIIHHKDFAKWERRERDSKIDVVVIGGAKSAADVAYSCAKAGHKVTWLIRQSGSGPAAFVSAKGTFGYRNSNESFYTRFTSLFLASLYSFGGKYNRLLRWMHAKSTGRKMLQSIWRRINDKASKEAAYDRSDGNDNGFYNLKPDTELFWQNDSTGINQRADFFDVIARQVRVLRGEVLHMEANSIVLHKGKAINAEAVICATGWKVQHPYFDHTSAARLGLPIATENSDPAIEKHWTELTNRQEKIVFATIPILHSEWARSNTKDEASEQTPFRLWKRMVPIHDPSIVFVGELMLGNHFRNAEVQALFACAILSGVLDLPSLEERELDVARDIAWCKARYPGGKGNMNSWLYWDLVPYTDMLLAEIGLHSHRHANIWKDLFRPCVAKDLQHLIDELRLQLIEK